MVRSSPSHGLHFADPDTQEFIQTIEDCFYSQHVLCPTRGDAILDIILSRDPDLVSNVTVIGPTQPWQQ